MREDKYKTNVLPRIEEIKLWSKDGATQKQIAQRLGICCQTFNKYKQEHQELLEALSNEKDIIIRDVENALLKKAKGYVYTETKTVDKGDKVEVTTTEKEVPPDLSAISFLLKNFAPEKWSDKPAFAKDEPDGGGVVLLPEIIQEDEDI